MSVTKTMTSVLSDTGQQVKELVKTTLGTEEILWQNEVKANRQVAQVMLISAIVVIFSLILDIAGIYDIPLELMIPLTVVDLIFLLNPAFVCIRTKGENPKLKIHMLACLVICYSFTDMILSYNVTLLMAVPVVLSSRYFSRKLTATIAFITTITFLISSALSYYGATIDLNRVTVIPGTNLTIDGSLADTIIQSGAFIVSEYKSELFWTGFIPKYFLFIIIAIVSAEIAHRGYMMIVKQDEVAKEHSRIDTELNIAKSIQEHALPIVHDLKANPSFDLAASMEPAKEIGGDFYDFVMIDDTHLALVIADVSGKGVPAAMLMMVSKILLDNSLAERKNPGAVMADVNHQLCEKNPDDMFVTVWLGIIDLTTGKMVTANGGHEYPIIKRRDGKFEVFKDKHGLVIGAMDGMRYPEAEIILEPGDEIFVYTDGVTEAHNEEKELFTLDATCKALNEISYSNMNEMLAALRGRIAEFSGEAEQFDDITMMGFKFNEYMAVDGITLEPTLDSIPKMKEYLEGEMEKAKIPTKFATKMNVAIDEIYSNIVHYSQGSWVCATCDITKESLTVKFRDNGIPYNPLDVEAPDLSLSAEERAVGGLGIFMTKKLMDEFLYDYEDGVNITTLVLNL